LNYKEGYCEKRENNYKPNMKYDRWKARNGCEVYPRANGEERRSGRKPEASVLIPSGYLHRGNESISEVLSSSKIASVTNDLEWVVILTDLKNMADCL
jgi:hypothetical protein